MTALAAAPPPPAPPPPPPPPPPAPARAATRATVATPAAPTRTTGPARVGIEAGDQRTSQQAQAQADQPAHRHLIGTRTPWPGARSWCLPCRDRSRYSYD